MKENIIIKSMLYGVIATIILLSAYFGVITFISGWNFALGQFSQFRYFIMSLAVGFGIQISLYTYLKNIVHEQDSSEKILVVSGATSTGAMISCCAHYLVNILPILGVTGFVSIVSQYQSELFWVGIMFNVVGIIYILRKVIIFRQQI